jgi:hypothetical protein
MGNVSKRQQTDQIVENSPRSLQTIYLWFRLDNKHGRQQRWKFTLKTYSKLQLIKVLVPRCRKPYYLHSLSQIYLSKHVYYLRIKIRSQVKHPVIEFDIFTFGYFTCLFHKHTKYCFILPEWIYQCKTALKAKNLRCEIMKWKVHLSKMYQP